MRGSVLLLLATACSSPDAPPPLHVALRTLGGEWQVSTPPCDAVIATPADAPYELVAWYSAGSVSAYQAGPGDAVRVLASPCEQRSAPDFDVRNASGGGVSYGYTPERRTDVIAVDGNVNPQYFVIVRAADQREPIVVDFAARRGFELVDISVASGTPSWSISSWRTARGAVLEHFDLTMPLRGWLMPEDALQDSDRQEVGVEFDDHSTVTFDARAMRGGPFVASKPPEVTVVARTGAGVAIDTAATFNEWTIDDSEIAFCESACEAPPWKLTKLRGWPAVATGATELVYPSVSAIPGFDGAPRPSPGGYMKETRVSICNRGDAMRECTRRIVLLD